MVANFESSAIRPSSLPSSTNFREVKIRSTFAAWQPARKFIAPAVKFSIAGTRPMAWSAKNVTVQPTPVGSITPTDSRARVMRLIRPPSAKEARMMSS